MNTLTHAEVGVKNQLFSTLDTRTRQWHLHEWGRILLSDTVGFIRDLPHGLVASFKATLEESRQAKLLLHVVDASNPEAEKQIEAVNAVLTELEVADKPTVVVLNKIDAVKDRSIVDVLRAKHPGAIAISGLTGEGLDRLADAVMEGLSTDFTPAEITMSASNGKALAYLNAHAEIFRQEYRDNEVLIRCYLPRPLLRHVTGPDVSIKFLHGEANGHQPEA